jgi:hypothetical protein
MGLRTERTLQWAYLARTWQWPDTTTYMLAPLESSSNSRAPGATWACMHPRARRVHRASGSRLNACVAGCGGGLMLLAV